MSTISIRSGTAKSC